MSHRPFSGPSSSTVQPQIFSSTGSYKSVDQFNSTQQSQSSIHVNLDSSLIQPLEDKLFSSSFSTMNGQPSQSQFSHNNKQSPAQTASKDQRGTSPPGVLESKDYDPPSSELDNLSDDDDGRVIEVQARRTVQIPQPIQTQFQQNQQFFTPNGPIPVSQLQQQHQSPNHHQQQYPQPQQQFNPAPPYLHQNQSNYPQPPMQLAHPQIPLGPEDDGDPHEEEGESGSYYSDESSSEDESPRENRVLTFADEHGRDLCYFSYYEIEVPVEEEEIPEPQRRVVQPTRTNEQPTSCMGKCVIS